MQNSGKHLSLSFRIYYIMFSEFYPSINEKKIITVINENTFSKNAHTNAKPFIIYFYNEIKQNLRDRIFETS